MDEPISISWHAWEDLIGKRKPVPLGALGLPCYDLFPSKENLAARAQPAITRVNRSIRADALKMYYRNNTFVAEYCHWKTYDFDTTFWMWTRAIGEENRRNVGELIVWDECPTIAPLESEYDEENDWCLRDLKSYVREMQGTVGSRMTHQKYPSCKITFKETD